MILSFLQGLRPHVVGQVKRKTPSGCTVRKCHQLRSLIGMHRLCSLILGAWLSHAECQLRPMLCLLAASPLRHHLHCWSLDNLGRSRPAR